MDKLQLLLIFHIGGDICGYSEGDFGAFPRPADLSGPGF